MTDKVIRPEERFSNTITNLCKTTSRYLEDAVRRGFNLFDNSLLELAIVFIREQPGKDLIHGYIVCSIDFWPIIKTKERDFLIKNMMDIFGSNLTTSYGEDTKELFNGKDTQGAPWVGSERESKLWLFFRSLTRISLTYLKEKPEARKEVENLYQTTKKRPLKVDWSDMFEVYLDNWQ